MSDWKKAALLSLGLLACAEEPAERPPAVLGRVGETEITERDFALALRKLPTGTQAKTLEDWRRQFQVLVDKELLLHEARLQGLDPAVAPVVQAWERTQLVEELLEREMGEALAWNDAELVAFFAESGAGREIRLNRLVLATQVQAFAALQKAQTGAAFSELAATYGNWSESDWLNVLNAGDERMASLFLLEVGAVELVEAKDQYLLMGLADERQVTLEERRPLVAQALSRRKKQRANLAYLEYLTAKYAVRLDTAALRRTFGGQARAELRLVSSSLGDWSTGEYRQALNRLDAGANAPAASVAELGFKVTRAFVADRLLAEEAKRHELYAELAPRREKLRQQKLIEALWEGEIFSKIQIDPSELITFYEANKERYAGLAEHRKALQNQVVQDLRDAKAAPLFDRYIEQLRQKHASIVSVEEALLGEFVSRRRQAASPVDL